MRRREGDEVREAFERELVPVVDMLGHRVRERLERRSLAIHEA